MGWNALGTQFCLELAFGVLLALAFVPKAPVGTLFYRIMATTALAPLLLATVAPPLWGSAQWSDAGVWTASLALLAYPAISGPLRGRKWAFALAWSLIWTAAALVITVQHGSSSTDARVLFLCALSAMATGSVAGSVGLAMVLGHWYLTIPTLHVRHLRRLNVVTIVCMCACILLLAITCGALADRLSQGERPLLGPTGLFYLGTRVTVGLILPLVFAWMTSGSLKFGNTRSATGILYASTILVLIGTAVSISLQDSYGVPL
jgi:hypothetical protein